MKQQKSIGREKAIEMAESKWWEQCTPFEICDVQLFTREIVMPFDEFVEAMQTCLNRLIWTHEFGSSGLDGLISEYLKAKESGE